jgi:hypothetical protein
VPYVPRCARFLPLRVRCLDLPSARLLTRLRSGIEELYFLLRGIVDGGTNLGSTSYDDEIGRGDVESGV